MPATLLRHPLIPPPKSFNNSENDRESPDALPIRPPSTLRSLENTASDEKRKEIEAIDVEEEEVDEGADKQGLDHQPWSWDRKEEEETENESKEANDDDIAEDASPALNLNAKHVNPQTNQESLVA